MATYVTDTDISVETKGLVLYRVHPLAQLIQLPIVRRLSLYVPSCSGRLFQSSKPASLHRNAFYRPIHQCIELIGVARCRLKRGRDGMAWTLTLTFAP